MLSVHSTEEIELASNNGKANGPDSSSTLQTESSPIVISNGDAGSVDLKVAVDNTPNHHRQEICKRSSVPITIGTNASNAALPKINNTNTVIMRAASRPENGDPPDLMLMHNTRIFYFEADATMPSKTLTPLDAAADKMTNNINDMLMTPKYRSLSAFYLSFHLLDHAILVSIILSLFTGENSYLEFAGVFLKHWELFVVIALEAIYNVLEYHVRVWILNRVSVYFVLALYILYVTVVTVHNMWSISVTVLLSVRFLAFLCELLVDFLIDLEVHHDLTMQKIHSMPVKCIYRRFCGNIGYELTDEHDLIDKLPTGWRYKGSIVAWTPLNTFNVELDNLRTEELADSHRFIFEIMVIFTIIITLPVTMIVGLVMGTLSMIRSCCCCRDIKYNNTIFAECTRNSSW